MITGLDPITLANPLTGAAGLRRFVAALLLLWLLLALPAVVHGQYTYTTTNNQITLTGYTGSESVLILPATINDLPVTCLGASAFQNSSLTGVTIPNSVTSIGANAFEGSTRLTSVKIGDSVTSLGVEAFYRCSGLTNVFIPNSVTSIGAYTFQGCTGLTRVTIPNSVTSIGVSPFMDCTSLTEINVDTANSNYSSVAGVLFDKAQATLVQFPGGQGGSFMVPNSVTTIWTYAFYGCTGLTSVTIPNSVTNLGTYTFQGCTGLTNVTIPNSVTNIGEGSFAYCSGLTNVTIPNSVTSIGVSPFMDCTSLTEINVDAANSNYSSMAGVLFDKAQATLIQFPGGQGGSFTVPNSVTTIWNYAFYRCTGLTGVTIPNSVTNIGEGSFAYCTGLTNVTIPTGVTSIEANTFFGCSGLTRVTIPNSVTSIGVSPFYGCTGLTEINVDAANSNYSSMAGVLFDKAQATLIRFPGGQGGSFTVPNSVNVIGDDAFSGCTGLTNVTVPNSVTNIAANAFYYCNGLKEINVDAANSNYSSMAGVLFDKAQATLIQFPGGKSGHFTIPNGVNAIGDYAFYECSGLTQLTIPNSVNTVEASSFSGCSGLTDVYFQGNKPSVSPEAFSDDSHATVYYLPRTMNWESTFAGRPTVLWDSQIQTSDTRFGVKAGQFEFNVTGTKGLSFVVEATTDLSQPVWTPVSTNTLLGGTAPFSDPQWQNYPSRLYRLRTP